MFNSSLINRVVKKRCSNLINLVVEISVKLTVLSVYSRSMDFIVTYIFNIFVCLFNSLFK